MLFSSLKLWVASVARWLRREHPVRVSLIGCEAERDGSEPKPLRHSLWALFRSVTRAQKRRQVVMNEVARHVAELNESDVPVVRRCLHMAFAEYLVRGAVNSVYADYYARDENPESEQRKELTSAAIEVSQQLARGYREILRALQSVSDNTYTLCQTHAWNITHRVFELVQAEQYLCALRHMKLSEKSWRMLNQLYFSVHGRAEAEKKFPIAGYLRKPARAAWQPRRDSEVSTNLSIRQIFVTIHVTGMIDPPSWSAQQFAWVQAYVGRSLTRLKVHPMSVRVAGSEFVVVAPNQASAATLNAQQQAPANALQINLGPLIRRLQHDSNAQGLGKDLRHAQRNRMLATLSGGERWQLIDRMMRKLRYQAARDARDPSAAHDYVDLVVSWGFAEAYQSTVEMTRPDGRDKKSPTPEAIPSMRTWTLINESDSGLLFRFTDTRGMKPFFVGQLMSYSKCHDESRRGTVHIGYVARIQRDRSGSVDVGIQKLATEAECARVLSRSRYSRDDALPAFVARCRDGKWRIVLHSRHGSYTLEKTMLDYDGQKQPLVLGTMFLYQSEFVVFDLPDLDHV